METGSSSDSLIGSVIADRYRIDKLLGEGGMGAVYLAEHVLMRKRVALKLLHADMSGHEEILGRFQREAQAAARISHPNVAAATDFGQTADGSFFLVLEYVQGHSLRKVMDERGIIPPARALHIVRQIALGLERAHEAGIIHRDLKPDNIMLVERDGDPDFVKILDFGIAKVEPHAMPAGRELLTRHGTIIGTPEYMSPEQAAGEPAGAAADFYSVGVMLYEMLSHRIPFDAEERAQILNLHINARPPPLGVPVPPPVEALVMRLLAKTPAERPADAAQLRTEIDAAAAQSGIELAHTGSNPSLQRLSSASVQRLSDPSSPAPPSAAWQASDSLAKTEYGLKSEDVLANADAKTMAGTPKSIASNHLGIPGLKLGPLDAMPRAVAIGILGAPFFVVAFVIVVIASLASHHSTEGGAADAATTTATGAEPRSPHASAAQIVAAKASGVGALEALSNDFPNDTAVLAELARAYANAGRTSDLLKIVRTLDPAAIDDEILGAVVTAAEKPDTADEAFATLEGSMGGRGVDGLIELSAVRATRARANRALARSDVRAHATPAANVFLEFRSARDCAAKHELLERAKDVGDARLLPVLKPMQKETGCGFLGHKDCFPCLRKDDDLGDAIRAIEGRNPQKP